MSNRSRLLTETNTPSALSWSVAGAGRSPIPSAAARAGATPAGAGAGTTRRARDGGRAGRGEQEHAPGVLLLAAHGQEGAPLDRDAGGVQRVGERVYGASGDLIRCEGYRCHASTVVLRGIPVSATPIHRPRHAPVESCP